MLRSYELSLPKILRVMRLSELKTGEKGVIVKVLGHGVNVLWRWVLSKVRRLKYC